MWKWAIGVAGALAVTGGALVARQFAISAPPLAEQSLAQTYRATTPAAVEPPASDASDALALGEVEVRLQDGRVVLRANQAPRRRVLAQLAFTGRFEVRDYTTSEPLVTAHLDGGTWPQAIALTVRDTPYAIRFGQPAASGEERVRALEVGIEPSEIAASGEQAKGSKDEKKLEESGRENEVRWQARPYSDSESAAWLASRPERQARRHAELIAGLANGDSEERAFAVFSLDPEDPASLPHFEAALLDADPAVRLEAVRQLGFAGERGALGGLQRALSDSSSEVVIAAIEEIAGFEDPRALDALRALDPASPAVEDALESALLAYAN